MLSLDCLGGYADDPMLASLRRQQNFLASGNLKKLITRSDPGDVRLLVTLPRRSGKLITWRCRTTAATRVFTR
jgi:hypothetical protein